MDVATVIFSLIVSLAFGAAGDWAGGTALPVHVYAGDDALVPCVAPARRGFPTSEADAGVLWRRGKQLLTAGERRVAADPRFGVLHESGGDVWVLIIRKVTASDGGLYVCETIADQPTRSFHKLNVLSRPSEAYPVPHSENKTTESAVNEESNLTECCVTHNVSTRCLPLCSLLPKPSMAVPNDLAERCAMFIPNIANCMSGSASDAPVTGGSGLRDCCVQRVSAECVDWCVGVRPPRDSLKARMSCAAHAADALTCSAGRIHPGARVPVGRPRAVDAVAVAAGALNVSWEQGPGAPATAFVVSAHLLAAFDDDIATTTTTSDDTQEDISRKVSAQSTSVVLSGLRPFAMYEVRVTATDGDQESISDAVRALTLPPMSSPPGPVPAPAPAPTTPPPDPARCCRDGGLTDNECAQRLCSGAGAAWASGAEAAACGRWAHVALPCMLAPARTPDETPCCRGRGVPRRCLSACVAPHTQNDSAPAHPPPLDFSFERCAAHASDVWACAVRGRGLLPSAPRRLSAPLLRPTFALLRWTQPAALPDAVRAYALRWRPLPPPLPPHERSHGARQTPATHDAAMDYRVERAPGTVWVLEGLAPQQRYEAYVQAVGDWGAGFPSARLLFTTPPTQQLSAGEGNGGAGSGANASACCQSAGLPPACRPLCAFDVSLEAATALAAPCAAHLHTLLRCGANGREHWPCCERRGVPAACARACVGVLEGSPATAAETCAHFIGDILQCFEEGAGLLPGPVEELSAERVGGVEGGAEGAVALRWSASSDGAPARRFVVHFQKEDADAPPLALATCLAKQMNVSKTWAEIRGLEPGALYRFFVVAENEHGSSLPSSILVLNVSRQAGAAGSRGVAAVPSPPHSLAVAGHSATWLSISWQPPLFSLPSERLTYKVLHKAAANATWSEARTGVPAHTLQGLSPNAQYIAYVVAEAAAGASLPSETLVAWTDPAYPAFVEPPTVHPTSLVTEGGTMTVLCIAMGAPTPTISLYVAGRLIRQEVSRHMVTVVHNVTRDMETVACYADNGYGTPMQAARRIAINYPPRVRAGAVTRAAAGESAALECRVWARPEPQMVFWKDAAGRVPVVQGGRFDISIFPDTEEEWAFTMRLTVHRVQPEDAGQFFCRADNALGEQTEALELRVREQPVTSGSVNLTACCLERNVSAACLDACTFSLDLSGAATRTECAPDLPALARCAADGADHRSCCALRGVPRSCIEWCGGRPLAGAERCAQQYAVAMADCFASEHLPGPPRSLLVDSVDSHSARVRWLPPIQNSAAAEMYRVFWREVGAEGATVAARADTRALSLRLTGLRAATRYEVAVKAGSRAGSGVLSTAVRFTTAPSAGAGGLVDVVSSATRGEVGAWRVGTAVTAAVAVLAAAAAAGVWYVRRRRGLGAKSPSGGGGVAFENPTYLREMLNDRSQVTGHAEATPSAACSPPSGDTSAIFPITGESILGSRVAWTTDIVAPTPQDSLEATPQTHPQEQLNLSRTSVGFKLIK